LFREEESKSRIPKTKRYTVEQKKKYLWVGEYGCDQRRRSFQKQYQQQLGLSGIGCSQLGL
jgi:hypothetical protein